MIKNFRAKSVVAALSLMMLPLAVPANQQHYGDWGIETRYISTSVRPGDDFYRYVNEGWLNTATLPQGLPRHNSFIEVSLRTEDQLTAIIDELIAGKGSDTRAGQQIRDLYLSYMDDNKLEQQGIDPIQQQLRVIQSLASHKQIAAEMMKPMVGNVFSYGIDLHPMEPDRYTFYLAQGGLSLPESVYYTSDEAPFPAIREAYRQYIVDTFTRVGFAQSPQRGEAVLAFETALARLHWSPEEQRDRIKNYHPMTREELSEFAPGFDWVGFLASYGVENQQEFVIETDSAVQKIAALFAATPIAVLRDYAAFHYVDNLAPYLADEFAEANFGFYGTRISGIAEQRKRSLRALKLVNDSLGEVLGQLYVERYFPEQRKAEMEGYIPFIRDAFRARMERSPWMDEATRREALAKLEGFTAKIGYPDKWRDMHDIEIKPDDLVGNLLRIRDWGRRDALQRLREPVRTWEWGMSPQTVNAYYSSMRNEIVFPAAILQPPFFQAGGDHAVNFGAIGAVIGHEMGHGFDDQGSKSDVKGVLRDWWTQSARASFDARAKQLVDQYSGYEPLPGTHVSGQLTLGENIGDLGGVAVAYSAYRQFVAANLGGDDEIKDGFSGDQRFFMAWAQIWRAVQTEDFLRKQVLTDPHSPPEYRVNGIVRNLDAWYSAFGVDKHDELYLSPEERVKIW